RGVGAALEVPTLFHHRQDAAHGGRVAKGRVEQLALREPVALPETNEHRPLLGGDVLPYLAEAPVHLVPRRLVHAVYPEADRVVDDDPAVTELILHGPSLASGHIFVNATISS